jgi:hypothetical protein
MTHDTEKFDDSSTKILAKPRIMGRMRSLYASGLLVFGILCMTAAASAQQAESTASVTAVPRLVHFAGSFHPPANQPIGQVGATFSIYSEQEGGTPLWSEDQNVELDANGNYTSLLGSTKNGGLPAELFATSDARWLQVKFHLPDEVSLPRVLLVSVPYALKAADAETVGGLPPSAFVLAAPTTNGGTSAMSSREAIAASSAAPALSGTGTADFVPLWTNGSGVLGNSVLFQSGTGSTAMVGINTTTPASTLDVKGAAMVRGTMTLPATSTATASGGQDSHPFILAASAFNSGTSTAQTQNFRLQAEATGNDTTAPSGTLNLMFAEGTAAPVETGLHIASNGRITFATGQTFPGAGTITGVTAGSGLMGGGASGSVTVGLTNACSSGQVLQWNGSAWACAAVGTGGITGVTAGTDLTGGGTSGTVTLNVDTTKVPRLSVANTFTGNQTVNGNLSATGVVTGSSFQIGSSLFGFGSLSNGNAFLGFGGNSLTTGASNTGIGALALSHNTVGSDNTATGDDALESNTTGQYNTATGSSALAFNTVGFYNTADGFAALISDGTSGTGGGNNTAIGNFALSSNDTGSSNTAVGSQAMTNNTTGALNTAVGYSAGPVSSGLTNATAIGAWSSVNESNALILGGTGTYAVSVGIGTGTPYNDYALDVEATPGGGINGGVVSNSTGGNIYLGMTNGVHQFRVDTNGVAYANGGFLSSGADFAESFAVRGQRSGYEPGDLLVIDSCGKRRLSLAQTPYSTLVAGIYSTKPGVLATPHNIDDPRTQTSEVPLAVVGIVPSKVSAENGPIEVGDLLVTSSLPGYAMKGTNRRRMLGAVVGKALEPLSKGTGVIQVLVTLQ